MTHSLIEPLPRRTTSSWPRAVLIATSETASGARAMLAASGGAELLGTVLIGEATADDDEVLGGLEDLETIQRTLGAALAIVSLPAAMGETIGRVRSRLAALGLTERFIPPVEDLLAHAPPVAIGVGTSGSTHYSPSPRIDLGALIGRRPREIDREAVGRVLRGRRVLITGAGGSIGSELARLASTFDPSALILIERAENALFEIDRRLAHSAPDVERTAMLHDVVDAEATRRRLTDLRPDVVFHAAAHKHVPLMEDHPALAVQNNLLGTKSIADAAKACGCERFVMISTDKAVNPSSVMGATKRLAELYVRQLHAASREDASPMRCSIVRFGNVLGSACSVLTIWSAQIAEGAPISVTDERMTRFFMTIPEAASLVMQSAAIETGEGAGLYVLDMGEPIRILELAERFVRAHGLQARIVSGDAPVDDGAPGVDIIVTGIRPGEKLHEELSYQSEELRPTGYDGIDACPGGLGDETDIERMIGDLSKAAAGDSAGVHEAIRRYVPQMPH